MIKMNILSVDSCSCVATGAIMCGEVLTAEFVLNNNKTHSVKLLGQIENILRAADMIYNDIDYFACTAGPGSFTGQRIGTATVKGLAHAVNKPVVGVSSLEAMAYNVPFFDGLVCPIMDARRNQVYNGVFKFKNGVPEIIKPDRAIALSELLDELSGNKVIFLGDGVPVFRNEISDVLGDNAFFAPAHLLHIRGGSVAACAMQKIKDGIVTTYDKLLPSYLRMSQAERELKNKLRS